MLAFSLVTPSGFKPETFPICDRDTLFSCAGRFANRIEKG